MKKSLFLLAILAFSLKAFSATITSIGGTGNWSSTASWSGGVVPGTSDDVIIAGTITVTANANCQNLTVNSGATLTINTGYTLTLNNNSAFTNNGTTTFQSGGSNTLKIINSYWSTCFTNNGTFNAGTGTLELTGSNNSLTISNNNVTFYNVTLNAVQQTNFGSNATVNGTLRINADAFITTFPTFGSNAVLEVNRTISMNGNYYLWPSGSGSNVPPTISIISGTVTADQMECYVKKSIKVASGATFNAANTCFTFASTFTGITNKGTFTLGGVLVPSGSTWNVNQNYTLSTLKIENGGTVNCNSYALTLNASRNNCNSINGIMEVASGGTFNAGTGTMIFNPPTWMGITTSSTVPFNNVVVNGPSTLNIPNSTTFSVSGNLTVNSGGTVNAPNNIVINSGATVTNNGSTSNGSFNAATTSTSTVSGTSGGGTYSSPTSISSPNVYTLTSDMVVNGSGRKILIVSPGAELVTNGYKVTCDTVYVYGKVSMNSLSGITGSVGNATTVVLGSGSTMSYNASSGTQNITARSDYANLDFSGAATKSLSGGTYKISGDFTSSGGTVSLANNPTIEFNGTSQNIGAIAYKDVTFSNSGNKTLTDTTKVTGNITVSGSATLVSGGKLVLVSDSLGTASVGALTGSASVSGNVCIQRYIPAVARRYRMLSPNASGFTYAQMVDNIFITGSGGAANGFDASSQNQTTVYTYQESTTGTRGWKAITNISNTLAAGKGAMVFIRGDRTLSSPQWYTYPYVAQNKVVVDYNGPINSGTISPAITYTSTGVSADDGWNLVGNPYPSQISWSAVSKTNLDGFYYALDPSTNSYVANNSGVIASGQAFMVHATGASPSISFTESSKTTSSATSYFKAVNPRFTVTMIKDSINSDVAWLVPDSSASLNYLASEDAVKFTNATLNVSFVTPDQVSVQYNRAPLANTADTFIVSADAAAGTYTLSFSGLGAIPDGKNVILKDLFTNTDTDLKNVQSYTYTITASPASAGNRFLVIISSSAALPVSFIEFKGSRKTNTVALTWSTASEVNASHFSVERSNDGKTFQPIGSVKARGNSSSVSRYAFNDEAPLSGISYYRLKEVDNNGAFQHSGIVVMSISKNSGSTLSGISIFPVPASTELNVSIPVAGNVSYEVNDINGRTMLSGEASGSARLDVSALPRGFYFIALQTKSGERNVVKFVKN